MLQISQPTSEGTRRQCSRLHWFSWKLGMKLMETRAGPRVPAPLMVPGAPVGSGVWLPHLWPVNIKPVLSSPEFEVNVVVLLHPDHLITENFPLKLCRM